MFTQYTIRITKIWCQKSYRASFDEDIFYENIFTRCDNTLIYLAQSATLTHSRSLFDRVHNTGLCAFEINNWFTAQYADSLLGNEHQSSGNVQHKCNTDY